VGDNKPKVTRVAVVGGGLDMATIAKLQEMNTATEPVDIVVLSEEELAKFIEPELPDFDIPCQPEAEDVDEPSWTQLNKGKLSKKDRRK
jgi:hypothetical protein